MPMLERYAQTGTVYTPDIVHAAFRAVPPRVYNSCDGCSLSLSPSNPFAGLRPACPYSGVGRPEQRLPRCVRNVEHLCIYVYTGANAMAQRCRKWPKFLPD